VQDLGAIFFTSGDRPKQRRRDAHSQLYFFAQEVACFTRLTPEDVYLTTTPLFHGNAQFMAAYPALLAGGRAVVRPKFSASRWIDHVRDSGVTVTNFVGVMMDFAWKQAPRSDDRNNHLRCVYAAPTASSIVEEFKERYGIEAFVDAFGLTETSAPIISPTACCACGCGCRRRTGSTSAGRLWTDREVAVGEIEFVVRPVHP
jgi:crotonobetaine/carnitine-CoA ligase